MQQHSSAAVKPMPLGLDVESILVLRLRRPRIKSKDVAGAEVAALLRDLGGRPAHGGPLSEVGGVAWVSVPTRSVELALQRLPPRFTRARCSSCGPSRRSSRGPASRSCDVGAPT